MHRQLTAGALPQQEQLVRLVGREAKAQMMLSQPVSDVA
jgi:hypothetical protein